MTGLDRREMVGVNGDRAAAFFDVDGTLSATRSTSTLVWLRARQHSPWRHRLWLAILSWRAPLAWATDKISRALCDRLVYGQFAGLSEALVEADAEDCCHDLLLPSCFTEALAEIDRHKGAGRQVVLLTGGVEPVLRPLARALNADLIAQRLDAAEGIFTGRYLPYALLDPSSQAPSQGVAKARAMTRYAEIRGFNLDASFAYGDSRNDIPMLRAVGHPVAVNPDDTLKRVAQRNGWPVRQWRSIALEQEFSRQAHRGGEEQQPKAREMFH
jgi:alcohol-forming fatty acyl-CoA reductase